MKHTKIAIVMALFLLQTAIPLLFTNASTAVISVLPSTNTITGSDKGTPFSIAVTFAGPMDTSVDPTIILTPDLTDVTGSGTLVFDGTRWSPDGTTYTVDYTVVDQDERYPSVTAAHITTTGATGNNGVYKIGDTITVTWDSSATGDDNANIATVTADFSEFGGGSSVSATDASGIWTASYTIPEGTLDNVANLAPSISVTNTVGDVVTMTDDVQATLDNKINGYSISIPTPFISAATQTAFSFDFQNAEVGATYDYDISGIVTGTGTIVAANDAIADIDVTSIPDGALTLSAHLTDAAGNVGTAVTTLPKIKDTTVPSATAAVSTQMIDLSSVGATFDVVATFDEPMNMAVTPKIIFSPNIMASGSLTFSTFGWIDNKTYKVTYDTHNVSETKRNITVSVSGAKDQHANSMTPYILSNALSVVTAPVAVITPTPPAPTPTSPVPAPKASSHSSGGGNPITPVATAGFVVSPAAMLSANQNQASGVVNTESATVAPIRSGATAVLEDSSTQRAPIVLVSNVEGNQPSSNAAGATSQTAAAANAGADLFSGSNIYLWILILISLLILGRVVVSIVRKEHR